MVRSDESKILNTRYLKYSSAFIPFQAISLYLKYNFDSSTCMPCTPYSPCPSCTVWRPYSPWIQCPPKFGSPRKYLPKITTAVTFGCLRYEARDVLPTPPVLCSPPPYYPVLVGLYLVHKSASYYVTIEYIRSCV